MAKPRRVEGHPPKAEVAAVAAENQSERGWNPPPKLSRVSAGVLVTVVAVINLPLIHYHLFRGPPKATVAFPFSDDYSNPATIPTSYFSTGGFWRVVGGELLSPGVKNNPLWLLSTLPRDVIVEFDARCETPGGDIRAEIFGDGTDHGSGYVLIFGGWNNSRSVLARLDENAPVKAGKDDTRERIIIESSVARVTPGQKYHWTIQRTGSALVWSIDGHELLRMDDPNPLSGKGHDRFGLSTFESQVYFDNLVVRSADSAAASPTTPPQLLAIDSSFSDSFDRQDLGSDWLATNPTGTSLSGGSLQVEFLHNRPVWLQRALPLNAVVEFDAWSDSSAGDIKIELWGDGRSFYSGDLTRQYTASGYVFILGGWNNTVSAIARMNEHLPNQPTRRDFRVEPGRRYHWRIERKGGQFDWHVDGQPFLSFADTQPLAGDRNSFLGFSGWESRVHFDNLMVRAVK